MTWDEDLLSAADRSTYEAKGARKARRSTDGPDGPDGGSQLRVAPMVESAPSS